MTDNSVTTLIPHLCCRNASQAAEFYQKAFGAEKLGIFKFPDGRVAHAELKINGATFYVVDEWPERGGLSPLALRTTPVTLYLRVAECDKVFERAVAAGCKVEMPLQDMFWGDRYGLVSDPYGHKWEIATTVRKVSSEELEQILSVMGGCPEAAVAAS